jgi:carbon storage regulator CsrA
MLVIDRHVDESFTVKTPSGDCIVTITRIRGMQVRLGITAPKEWPIERDDIRHR